MYTADTLYADICRTGQGELAYYLFVNNKFIIITGVITLSMIITLSVVTAFNTCILYSVLFCIIHLYELFCVMVIAFLCTKRLYLGDWYNNGGIYNIIQQWHWRWLKVGDRFLLEAGESRT